ncbi:MAG TPA: proton-conducting transporter membrane subunit [Rhodopila sp.]|uniref:complex I subunit 5 family protein n=1 Tax=Rhodopila sp. TaxID=2480087 RepID=UPI002C0C9747|nr:proton-conducting transporter membrane subunit [Rhodopila sp.]HVY13980.1 proton-conducting transporter membrane subunit [Rhodopila sp.]
MSVWGLPGLVPLPVVLPLVVAGVLLAFSKLLPARLPDAIAVLTTVTVSGLCADFALHIGDQPLVYWFGGWTPRDGQVLGISFAVDPAGAILGAFSGLLFTCSLIFAWGYYDEVHAHFHVLMLLFMAGMVGFCLTHDLFNMFVWFEVMSVAAFALTGYALRSSSLVGALNFTVINTIGSYLILAGIGLLYAQGGALDFSALAQAVAKTPADPVLTAAFALVAMGFLIKAAQVPFQPWLADAHAVAPSPVSVIFSGIMVPLGLFGLARMVCDVFAASPEVHRVATTLLLGMGALTAVLGGVMALIQRHIKRLLAFSTISHTGIMMIGLASLNRVGLAGLLAYLIGHGLVKASLFMVAGIIEARCVGTDEIGLRGAGRPFWAVGIVMAVGALMLAGLPLGLMKIGSEQIVGAAHAFRQGGTGAVLIGAACTGAAVLRVAGRVFGGFGPVPGEEKRAPTEQEREKADRPLSLMLAPTLLLLMLAVLPAESGRAFLDHAATMLRHASDVRDLVPGSATGGLASPSARRGELAAPVMRTIGPWISVGLAIVIAVYHLGRSRIQPAINKGVDRVLGPWVEVLQGLHGGLIGDYVAWVVVGLAVFAVTCAFA